MESYQILEQISWYVFYFVLGAVIELVNLQNDQIIYRTFEKLAIRMKNLGNVLSLSVIVIILVLIFVFYRDSITAYNTYFNFGLTVLLVAINYLMVSETNKMRTAQTQPNVYIAVQPVDELNNIMELFIHNLGLGPAYNLKFIDPPAFQYSSGKFLSQLHMIKNEIAFLAPNQKMQIFMMQSNQVFIFNSTDPINIQIKYNDKDKNEFFHDYKIDLSSILNVQRIHNNTPFEGLLLNNLEEIKKCICNVSSNLGKISNNTNSGYGIIMPFSKNLDDEVGFEKSYEKFEIAQSMVKKILIEFLNDWKSYSQSNTIWSNEDAEYIEFIAMNNRLDYHLYQFIHVSNEIGASGALPDIVSDRLLKLAATMRVMVSQSDIVSSDAWGREYPDSLPNQLDKLLAEIKEMCENLNKICSKD